jgi:hypothetical protein
MLVVKHKDLKWGVYTSPQSGEVEIERYIVENDDDLQAFAKKFPQIKMFKMNENLKRCLTEGYIIILTDLHSMSGMPTYCFESKADNTHPSSMHRKRIGK